MDIDSLVGQALGFSAEMAERFGYVVTTDLAVHHVRNAIITPRRYFEDRTFRGAVYDGRGELVRSTLRFNVGDIVPVDTQHIDTLDGLAAADTHHDAAIYGGILFPILGHFCFETLGRLWPLVSLMRRTRDRKRPIPVCFHHWPGLDPNQFFANPFYRFVFDRFGIDRRDVLIIDRPTSFGTLLIPDAASIYHVNLNVEMNRVFDFLVKAQHGTTSTAPGRRKVYLSRSRWADNRRMANETEIEQDLGARGLEIVHSQDLAPAALIALLQDIDTLVTTDGSHAHLAVFCPPGARTVMLDTRPVPTQIGIERLRGLKAVHIPLYRSAIYTDLHVNDVPLLGSIVDRAMLHLQTT